MHLLLLMKLSCRQALRCCDIAGVSLRAQAARSNLPLSVAMTVCWSMLALQWDKQGLPAAQDSTQLASSSWRPRTGGRLRSACCRAHFPPTTLPLLAPFATASSPLLGVP